MAKITGPLFSTSASGSIGPRLTYSKRNSGAQVRLQKSQKDYESLPRKVVRDAYRAGLILWNSMPCLERRYWDIVERNGVVNV